MLKNNQKQLLPKLRFPEFVDEPAWVEEPLGCIADVITGNTPKTSNAKNYGGNELFVSPADISEQRYVIKTKKTLTAQGARTTRRIKENSILFVCIGSIGKVAQNKFECSTNQQINSIVPFDKYLNNFVYSILEKDSIKIASIVGRHVVPIINKTDFSSIMIAYPKIGEQQKIADFLSSIDEVIDLEGQKLEALQDHKKGPMQNLFPAEGKVPGFKVGSALRFRKSEIDRWIREQESGIKLNKSN